MEQEVKRFVFKPFVPALAIEGLCIPQHVFSPHGMMRTYATIPLHELCIREAITEFCW
ncbi:MAG: hypothetical protein OPY09_02990 [Nitrosopumilus sp.]|nr:hypothetical protein [Nitrosopumilus sp.]